MQRQTVHKIAVAMRAKKFHKRWQQVVSWMMAVVVFATTYALILPAITLTAQAKEYSCPLYVHEHSGECYDSNHGLICGQADYVIHTHDENCYDQNEELVCTLPEIEEHVHDADCYRNSIICGLEESDGHTHTADCYTQVLQCEDDHEHEDSCYAQQLSCTEQTEPHRHSDDCYEPVLVCAKAEIQQHSHTDECYETYKSIDPETGDETETKELVCGMPELSAHQHGDGCFTYPDTEETVEPTASLEPEPTTASDVVLFSASEPAAADLDDDTDPYAEFILDDPGLTYCQALYDMNAMMGTLSTIEFTTPEIEPGKIIYYRFTGTGHGYQYSVSRDEGNFNFAFYNSTGKMSLSSKTSYSASQTISKNYTYYMAIGLSSSSEAGSVKVTVNRTGNHSYDSSTKLCACGISAYNCGAAPDEASVSWYVDSDNVLHIEGTGAMADYTSSSKPKWSTYATPKNITGVVIGEGITGIGNNTFSNSLCTYTKLTSVSLPESLESIGSNAFYSLPALTSISIPDSVTSIGDYAFYGDVKLTGVSLGSGITAIPNSCFYNCKLLADVNIPESVTSIGSSAFYGCTVLSSAKLPEGLTAIGKDAFRSCKALTEISIPGTVTNFGDYAFADCTGIKTVALGEGLTAIGNYAFYSTGTMAITEVNLPDSLKTIGNSAFYNCRNLTSISFPQGLTTIGDSAFYYNTALTELNIPGSVTYLGASAFASCSKVASLVINEGVTAIGNSCFSGCTALYDLQLPESLTSIGSNAFLSCTSLEELELPDGISSIGSAAFSKCTGLTTVTLPKKLETISSSLFNGDTKLTTVYMPSGIDAIGSNAFYNCKALSSIEIPSGVTTIGDGAFYACEALTELELPEGVVSLGNSALYSCKKLSSVSLPTTLETIGSSAFYDCEVLEELVLPENVTSIGEYAFKYCYALTDINWPESIVDIPKGVFAGDKSLKSFTFPAQTVSVGEQAFYDCAALESINLPDTVTTLGKQCFGGCDSFKEVTVPDSVTNMATGVFSYCEGLVRATLPSTMTVIPEETFYKCTSLSDFTINDNVTQISKSAFYGCDSLEHIDFPDSLTTIGDSAFYQCRGLQSVELPMNVSSIGSSAFAACYSLEEVTIQGNNAFTFKTNMFDNDSSLERVILRKDGALNLTSAMFANSRVNDIVIGKEVNTVSITDMEALAAVGSSASRTMHFEGVNTFEVEGYDVTNSDGTVTRVSQVSVGSITLREGKYYVDENGVLYLLNESKGTATLVYCPADKSLEDYGSLFNTLSVEGAEYAVTAIDNYAFADNANITAISIPDTVTSIGNYAFFNCVNLASINGETVMKAALETLANASYSVTSFYNTAIWDATDNGVYTSSSSVESTKTDGGNNYTISATISFDNAADVIDSNNTAYTGKTATLTMNFNNSDSGISDTIRFYFQAESGCNIYDSTSKRMFKIGSNPGYPVVSENASEEEIAEATQIFYLNGESISGVFVKADEPNLYYLELLNLKNGDTLNLVVGGITFPNWTAGGTLSVWTDTSGGKDLPDSLAKLKWTTKTDTYYIYHNSTGSFTFKPGGTDSEKALISGGGTSTYSSLDTKTADGYLSSYGRNPVNYIDFEASYVLPEDLTWKDGVLDAIANGRTKVVTSFGTSTYESTYMYLYVELEEGSGEWTKFAQLRAGDGSGRYLYNGSLKLDDDGNVVIGWRRYNPNSSANITSNPVTVSFYEGMIEADVEAMLSELEETGASSITKTITSTLNKAEIHYYYDKQVQNLTEAKQTSYSGTASTGSYTLTKSGAGGTMGNDVTYTITVSNDTIFPTSGIDKIEDNTNSYHYIKPGNIEKMFNDTYGDELIMEITNLRIRENPHRVVTDSDGNTVEVAKAYVGENTTYNFDDVESRSDPCDEQRADMVISWSADKSYLEIDFTRKANTTAQASENHYTVGQGKDYSTMAEFYEAMALDVYNDTNYKLTWQIPDGLTLYGGVTRTVKVYTTYKDTFMYITADGQRTTSSKSKWTNTATSYIGSAYKTVNNTAEVYSDIVYKLTGTVNGETMGSTGKLKAGDIITYNHAISVSKAYSALPVVSVLHDSQELLIPVSLNPQLEAYGFETTTVSGVEYYRLNQPGTYNNVHTGNDIADTIIVSSADRGVETQIYWYMNLRKTYNLNYMTMVVPDGSSENATVKFNVLAESWLGEHQGHRLYDKISFDGILLTADMNIVTNADNVDLQSHNPLNDELVKHSMIEAGDQVVYRLEINPRGSRYTVSLSGSVMSLTLPTAPVDYWTKDNVKLYYVSDDGTKLSITDTDAWSISKGSVTNETTTQVITWDSGFKMSFDGPVYLYATLQFPKEGSDDWDEYIRLLGSETLYARTALTSDVTVSVSHILSTDSEGALQTGVYMTGSWESVVYNYNLATTAREYYANKSAFTSIVQYYVTVYNTGYGRLYLDDIQVVLPEGFTMGNTSLSSVASTKVIITDTQTGETVSASGASPTYRASTATNSAGQNMVILAPQKNEKSASYDSERDRYFLKANQYMTILFTVMPGLESATEDIATTAVTMPIYDYNGADSSMCDSYSLAISDSYSYITPNDGNQLSLTTEEAAAEGFDTTGYSNKTTWLSSKVSVQRGVIKPGIAETCGSTQIGNRTAVSWTVNYENLGEQAMNDYTITNVMMSPYTYTGSVTLKILTAPSSNTGSKSCVLFKATDLPAAGAGEKAFSTTYFGTVYVRQDYSDDGDLLYLTIRMPEYKAGIPANGSAVLTFNTTNVGNGNYNQDFINKTYLTPTQSFTRNSVTQGKYVLYDVIGDDEGNVPSVTAEAKVGVSYGYATTSGMSVTELTAAKAEDDSVTLTETENTTSSSAGTNYIIPSDTKGYFRYTMTVNNSGGSEKKPTAMSLFVLVNNLPELNDHSTMYAKFGRDSEYQVNFAPAELLNPTVTLVSGKTTTELSSDQYELLFTAATDFDYDDKDTYKKSIWTGGELTEDEGWYTLERCQELGIWDEMRSMRLVINDEAKTLMPANVVINVSYNATLATNDDAEESQTAWNSFGYLYEVDGTQLQAATSNVGVKTPGVPELIKQLVDYTGVKSLAAQDESFTFLLFKNVDGVEAELDPSLSADELFDRLSGLGISGTLVHVTVPEGSSESEALSLSNLYCYVPDETTGTWVPGDTRFKWEENEQYTILELDNGNGSAYGFKSINGRTDTALTFGYTGASYSDLTVINEKQSWKLLVVKKGDDGKSLADARFALYTKNKELAPSADTSIANAGGARRELTVDDTTWYLMDAQVTNKNGQIQWDGLMEDEYYLLELEAPEGYAMTEEPGQIVNSGMGGTQEVEVINYCQYELPYTGGTGIIGYRVTGLSIILLSFTIWQLTKKKTEE